MTVRFQASARLGSNLVVAKDGGVDVDFGGSVTKDTASADALKAFIECLREQNAAKSVSIVHGVNMPIEPIGEVAEHWKADDDLRLTLMPGGDDKILNNLRIGPAVGRKQDIVRNWCGPDQAGACVKCTPENPTESTNYVEIQLRSDPQVERQQLPGVWPSPPDGKQPEPWQLLEPDGRRFVYVCKRT